MNCLDFQNEEVQKYLEKYSPEQIYNIYADNNFILPDYSVFDSFNTPVTVEQAIYKLKSIIPYHLFKIDKLDKLIDSLPLQTQAAYFQSVIYLSENPKLTDVYEEGFHAIFSSLIDDNERNQLLDAGKNILYKQLKNQGKTINEYVNEITTKYPQIFSKMSKQEKLDRIYEEQLAKMYVDSLQYKNSFNALTELENKLNLLLGQSLSKVVAKILNRIFDVLKSIYNTFKNNEEVASMFFKQINDGRFVNYQTQISSNDTVPLTRLLEIKEQEDEFSADFGVETKVYSSEETQKIIRNISSLYFQIQDVNIFNSSDEILNEAIKQFFTYSEELENIPNIYDKDFNLLNPDNNENIEYLKKDIYQYINSFNDLIDYDESTVESEEETQNDFAKFDKSANENSPYETSYSKQIKLRIAKAGKVKENSFKKVFINDKEVNLNFIEAVDIYKTYSALVRALSNTSSGEERFNKLINFAYLEGNDDTRAFIEQLIYDLFKKENLSYNEVLELGKESIKEKGLASFSGNNAVIINSILKGLDLWKRDNYILTYDSELKTSKLFDANINNVRNSQYNSWINNITFKTEEELKTKIPSINVFADIETNSRNIQSALDKKGIVLSREYIKYSILKSKPNEDLDNSELSFVSNFKLNSNLLLTQDVINIINDKYDKITKIDISEVDSSENGIVNKLKNIAQGNSIFDERVPDATYKAADGKTRYNYQYPTYHLQKVNKILKGEFEDFEINNEFLKENYLYKLFTSDKGKEFVKRGNIFNFTADGIRQQETLLNGTKEDSDGVVAGDMSDRDFLLYILNSAVASTKKGFIPVYFGAYEASKTYEFINLPIIKNLINDSGKLTNEGASLIQEEVRKEFNRIRKESFNKSENTYLKYNSGKTVKINGRLIPIKIKDGIQVVDFSNYRALQFSDAIKGLISNDLIQLSEYESIINDTIKEPKNEYILENINTKSLLVKALLTDEDFPNILEDIKKEINKLNENTIDYIRNSEANLLLDKRFEEINKNLDFTEDKKNNVLKVITSNLLNTLYINQLMQGDQALLYKNDLVDIFKRFKGRNASISNFETYTTAPELGITKLWNKLDFIVHDEIVARSGIDLKDIDQADAQNYGTSEYMRYAYFAMGKLNPELAKVFDYIDSGEVLSKELEDIILEKQLFASVLKTVAFDGKYFLKKSDFMLSKQLTSDFKLYTEDNIQDYLEFINNRYVPKIGATKEIVKWSDGNFYEVIPKFNTFEGTGNELHERRKVMEGWRFIDNSWIYTGEKIMLSMPSSASKMLNKNVLKGTDLKNITASNINNIDLKYYGLQVETAKPHDNIPDPTQYLEIALNEIKTADNIIIDGKKLTIDQLIDTYQNALSNRDTIKYKELKDEIFKDGKFNKELFKKIFVKSLEISGSEKQVIELAQEGQFNNPLIRDKFISQLFSYFTKDGLSQKRKGDASPHVSSYGMKLYKKIIKINDNLYTWEVVNKVNDEKVHDLSNYDFYPDIDGKPSKNSQRVGYNRLQDRLKELYESGSIYFIDELRHLKPRIENNKVTGYFDEMIMPKYDTQQLEIGDEKYMFGVRIPSQDKHSGVNLEWVSMFPVYYGSAVSVPKEIVQLSGSDFDIDKLYISKVEGYYEDNKFIKYQNNFEDFKKYYSNTTYFKNKLNDILLNDDEYNKLKKEIRDIKYSRKLAYDRFKIIEKDLEVEQVKDLAGISFYSSKINEILVKIEYDLASKEDLDLYKNYKYKLKNIFKNKNIKLSDIRGKEEKLNEYFTLLEDLYNVTDKKTNELLEDKILELKILYGLSEQQALKDLGLPYNSKTFNEYDTDYKGFTYKGFINNILLEANQQALANTDTLDGLIYDTPASMDYMANSVLTEFPININTSIQKDLPVESTKFKRTFQNEEYHQAFIKGGLEAVKSLIQKNKKYELETAKQLAKEVDLLLEFEEFTKISNKNDYENDRIIELFVLLKNSKELDFEYSLKDLGIIQKESKQQYLLSDDGKTFVKSKDNKYNIYSLLGQVNTQKNNSTGKSNIGIDVNWNLLNILLNRLQVEINPSYNINIDNTNYNSLELYIKNNDKLRVFDVISTLISSATDEAKEQLNARYGLDVNALNAVLPLVAMGGNLSLGIAIVNSPLVKEYLRLKSFKDYAIVSSKEKDLKFKNEDYFINKVSGLPKEMLYDISDSYTLEDLANSLRGFNNKDIDLLIFRDFLKLSDISSQGSNIVAGIKLSKGLPSDIYSFDSLLSKLVEIKIPNEDNPLLFLKALERFDSTKAKSFENRIRIVNDLDSNFSKAINLKSKLFREYREQILTEGKFRGNESLKELNNEIESFVYSQMYINKLEQLPEDSVDKLILKYINKDLITLNSDKNIEVIFRNFMKHAILDENLKDNVLLNKLQVNKREDENFVYLSLNQLVKLDSSKMDELQDSFVYLSNFDIPLAEDTISPLEFTKVLQAQLFVKDGMQFKFDGITKAFPKEVFKRFNDILSNVEEGFTLDDSYYNVFLDRYFKNMKHRKNLVSIDLTDTFIEANNVIVKNDTVIIDREKNKYLKLNYIIFKKEGDLSLYKLEDINKEKIIYKKTEFNGLPSISTMGTPINKLVFGQTILDSIIPVIQKLNKIETLEEQKELEDSKESVVTIQNKIKLNTEQQIAVDKVINFIKNGNPKEYFLIEGKAGTGKTFSIKEALKAFNDKEIIISALSHKAKDVIRESMRYSKIKVSYQSVAGMLGLKLNMETGEFEKDKDDFNSPLISMADIIVVDEASMINEEALNLIMTEKNRDAKVVFMGDIGQLPPIRTKINPYYANKEDLFDKKSPVFETKNKAKLLTRMRQGEESPILSFADYYWNNSQLEIPIKDPALNKVTIINNKGALIFSKDNKEVLKAATNMFKEAVLTQNPNLIKYVTYKNESRIAVNTHVHNSIFGYNSKVFNNGELIIFNDSFNSIENSTETQVKEVVREYNDIETNVRILELKANLETKKGVELINFPVIHPEDLSIYNQYVSKLFSEAFSLKGVDKESYLNALSKAWEAKKRYANIDYAYAITSHKSQGSTYDVVIVDEKDIINVNPISNRQKSESIYTAITRAKNITVLLTNSTNDEKVEDLNLINNKINNNKFVDKEQSSTDFESTCEK